jgi:RNA polymerase sigma-70 factor (ECF subfamily)
MTSDAAYFPDSLASAADGSASVNSRPKASVNGDREGRVLSAGGDVSGTFVPVTESSDDDLLEHICQGKREALASLFRRYARIVRTVAFRILRDEYEADDLLQEVFLFIFRKPQLFDATKGSARSWIVQVTYHRAIDRRRHLNSRRFYAAVDLNDPTAASLGTEIAFYERSLEGTLGKGMVQKIEESLSSDQRETLRLHFFEGYSIEEIAEKMEQTPGNVRNHYYRALEKMRKVIFSPKLPPK